MATPRDNARATYHIGPLQKEKMKTYAVRDGSQRVVILYEACEHVRNGEPCLATIYQYESNYTAPTATREKEALWDGAWDFDVLVNGEDGYGV